jgi:menaquinone-dependent protoporphyrinogen oxidase
MILIAFASKSGTAQDAAEKLAARLPEVDLVDLTKSTPALGAYSAVIIGSGVRVGSIHKAAKDFLAKHKDELNQKKWGLFITNSFADSVEEILGAALPDDLRATATWVGTVGGKLDIDKLKGLDKVIAKAATKAVREGQKIHDGLDAAALDELAACFAER